MQSSNQIPTKGIALMKLYIIDYYTADGRLADCYPDFCHSLAEAQAIAPEYMKNLDWAVSWRIREADSGEAA